MNQTSTMTLTLTRAEWQRIPDDYRQTDHTGQKWALRLDPTTGATTRVPVTIAA